jgi:hypothetical protein
LIIWADGGTVAWSVWDVFIIDLSNRVENGSYVRRNDFSLRRIHFQTRPDDFFSGWNRFSERRNDFGMRLNDYFMRPRDFFQRRNDFSTRLAGGVLKDKNCF